MDVISYKPPGANAAAFHQDDSFVRGLMGPVGSGKDVDTLLKTPLLFPMLSVFFFCILINHYPH